MFKFGWFLNIFLGLLFQWIWGSICGGFGIGFGLIFPEMCDFEGCQFCVKFCIDFGVALGANLGSSWRVLGRLGRLNFLYAKKKYFGRFGGVQVGVDFGIRLGTVLRSFWDRF